MSGKNILGAFFSWLAISMAVAYAGEPQKGPAVVDQIVAVVNENVITRHELDKNISAAERQLRAQGTPLPAHPVLERQALQRMILSMLLSQHARETGVRVDDEQVDREMRNIMRKNNLATLDQLRAALQRQGEDFKTYREDLRTGLVVRQLQEREVGRLAISDSEIDNYLATAAGQTGKDMDYHLARIVVLIPEQASAEKIRARQKRADEALAQLRTGADFAQVAAAFSDAEDALHGGDLGWVPGDRIPPSILEALQKMRSGEVTQVQGTNGFNIFKLIDRRRSDAPTLVTQTHLRLIMIRTSELVPDSEAKSRLLEIKRRIDNGASFAEQAKTYSEHGSAAQGGDLGWMSADRVEPEIEKVMNSLQPNEMSGPVQTNEGWYLAQVLERRNADVPEEQKRQRARMAIFQMKASDKWQDFQRELLGSAYIENRLEQGN